MKDKYIKNKKRLKSFLSIATTLIIISIFSFFSGSKYLIFAICTLIVGIIFLVLFILCNNLNNKLIKSMKDLCPICNKKVTESSEIKYYINGCMIQEKELNNENYNNMKKEKIVFNFYKCVECNYCLTEILTYSIKNKKELLQSTKFNVDFDYRGDY